MKTTSILLSLTASLLAITSISAAGTPHALTPPPAASTSPNDYAQVGLRIDVIDFKPVDAQKFFKQFQKDTPKERQKLIDDLMKNQPAASVSANPHPSSAPVVSPFFLTLQNKQPAMLESVHEFIYPNSYTPSDKKDVPSIPASFTTRNLGITIRTEAIYVANTKMWNCDFNFNWVRLGGMTKESLGIEQPKFYTKKIDTKFDLRAGIPLLAGVIGNLSPDAVSSKSSSDIIRVIIVTANDDLLSGSR